MSGAPSLSYLSIVVPCRDESVAIEGVVRDALQYGALAARKLEVIVVDDGSTDDSAARVQAFSEDGAPVRLVRHEENRGYGAAVRSGFDEARGDYVLLIDGDGQFDLGDLPRVASALDSHDVVVGYRAPRRDAPHRVINGLAWTWLTDALLDVGVRDVNCAFKLVPRSLVDRAVLRSEGALVSAELVSAARRLGLSIAEVPVRHLPRLAGHETGADISVVVRAFRELFGLVARRLAEGAPDDVTIPP